jgi:large subunit ribosomal protein L18
MSQDKNVARLRRARQTRLKIHELRVPRLAVHRTNGHIYVQLYSEDGARVLASASTVEKEVRAQVANGGNKTAATVIGKRIAEKVKELGIDRVAFDRGGFRYHGRVQALAEAAREAGLKF